MSKKKREKLRKRTKKKIEKIETEKNKKIKSQDYKTGWYSMEDTLLKIDF